MGLTASANALTLFRTQGQSILLWLLTANKLIKLCIITHNINGGAYTETVGLVDAEIPDNKKALRNNLAQQLLHEKMIDMQYNN